MYYICCHTFIFKGIHICTLIVVHIRSCSNSPRATLCQAFEDFMVLVIGGTACVCVYIYIHIYIHMYMYMHSKVHQSTSCHGSCHSFSMARFWFLLATARAQRLDAVPVPYWYQSTRNSYAIHSYLRDTYEARSPLSSNPESLFRDTRFRPHQVYPQLGLVYFYS